MALLLFAGTAEAQTTPDQIGALQDQIEKMRQQSDAQIKALQEQIDRLRQQNQVIQAQQQQQQQKAAAAGPAPTVVPGNTDEKVVYWTPDGGLHVGGIRIKPGGFIEAAGIWRSRDELADVGDVPFSQIPFKDVATSHESEVRESARQSRISLLATGDVDNATRLTAFYETDFLSSGVTSNSNESNSYTLRLRHAYATLDQTDWGFHALAGQSWSLLTQFRSGLTPRQENIPLTIDAQYVAGFNWTRQPQYRMWYNVAPGITTGLSVEMPQSTFTADATPAGVVVNAAGNNGGLLNNQANFSEDFAPDIILKTAFDPGFGHFEVFGLARFMRDSVNGTQDTTVAGGGGASMLLPLIPKKLELSANFLGGPGIGRYGTSGLSDATLAPSGRISPVTEFDLMVGLVGHPNPGTDLYLYAGAEKAVQDAFSGKFGYGNSTVNNTTCNTNTSAIVNGQGNGIATCQGDTKLVFEITPGFWTDVYRGSFGAFRIGAEYEFIRRETFAGIGGAPYANDNVFMTSVRYYPF